MIMRQALEDLLTEMAKRRQEVYIDPTCNLLGGKCLCEKQIRDCKHLNEPRFARFTNEVSKSEAV